MFESVSPAPPDAILGLTEAFLNDRNPDKVNLGVGVYKDEQGRTPVLASVAEAERRLIEAQTGKTYLPISGDPDFGRAVRELVFGTQNELVDGGRAVTAHTPGGTGALRIAGELLRKLDFKGTVWLSRPSWANHKGIFTAAGLPLREYAYYNSQTATLDFDAMIKDLEQIPSGDYVLLHACCHNPSGVDPNEEQWDQIAAVAASRGWIPLVDFAYQGFGRGLAEDAHGLLKLVKACPELLIAGSFSKNFGLYRERTGSLTLVAGTPEAAKSAFSHVKICIRVNYSNPPAHGGAIALEILADHDLRLRWEQEVTAMRNRINTVRQDLAEALRAGGSKLDYSFLTRQMGMFSFSGLNDNQVRWLREQRSIYIVRGGRINVAGIAPEHLNYVVRAIIESEAHING